MFQKVRIRLTLLCAGITIFILLIMSCGWLYVSEKSLRDNSFISFQNDMNTLVGNLEQQPVISSGWLKNMEDNGKYLIWLLDNGVTRALVSVELSAGQMIEDIKLSIDCKLPVYLCNRMGGNIPTCSDICDMVKKILGEMKQ